MIDKNIDRLSKRVGDVESLGNRCKEAVERKLKPYQDRFKPTLVHSDVHPDNCRYTKDGEVILIDWDNAMLYPWQMDMAIAMYWSWEPETMKKAFLKEYEDKGFKERELDEIVSAFHIIQGVNLVNFYLVEKRNKKKYKKVLEKLEKDINL